MTITNNILYSYKNGNYDVTLYEDGTKIRESEDDFFSAIFPENIDIKITDGCRYKCKYCHEGSTPNGQHGDILNLPFIDTLHQGTELAIGGGNPLEHPQLIPFLEKLKNKGIVSNLTIFQNSLNDDFSLIKQILDSKLIYGLGVSYTSFNSNIEKLQDYPNVILHTINGIVTEKVLEPLYNKNYKLLILGYKNIRRGISFYSDTIKSNQNKLYDILPKLVSKFNLISFDNLAIDQLKVKRMFIDDDWEKFYMGDDGQHTMYIDAVKNEYALSSTSMERFTITDNIDIMFRHIRSLK